MRQDASTGSYSLGVLFRRMEQQCYYSRHEDKPLPPQLTSKNVYKDPLNAKKEVFLTNITADPLRIEDDPRRRIPSHAERSGGGDLMEDADCKLYEGLRNLTNIVKRSADQVQEQTPHGKDDEKQKVVVDDKSLENNDEYGNTRWSTSINSFTLSPFGSQDTTQKQQQQQQQQQQQHQQQRTILSG